MGHIEAIYMEILQFSASRGHCKIGPAQCNELGICRVAELLIQRNSVFARNLHERLDSQASFLLW